MHFVTWLCGRRICMQRVYSVFLSCFGIMVGGGVAWHGSSSKTGSSSDLRCSLFLVLPADVFWYFHLGSLLWRVANDEGTPLSLSLFLLSLLLNALFILACYRLPTSKSGVEGGKTSRHKMMIIMRRRWHAGGRALWEYLYLDRH